MRRLITKLLVFRRVIMQMMCGTLAHRMSEAIAGAITELHSRSSHANLLSVKFA